MTARTAASDPFSVAFFCFIVGGWLVAIDFIFVYVVLSVIFSSRNVHIHYTLIKYTYVLPVFSFSKLFLYSYIFPSYNLNNNKRNSYFVNVSICQNGKRRNADG